MDNTFNQGRVEGIGAPHLASTSREPPTESAPDRPGHVRQPFRWCAISPRERKPILRNAHPSCCGRSLNKNQATRCIGAAGSPRRPLQRWRPLLLHDSDLHTRGKRTFRPHPTRLGRPRLPTTAEGAYRTIGACLHINAPIECTALWWKVSAPAAGAAVEIRTAGALALIAAGGVAWPIRRSSRVAPADCSD
jgi:hypothetical protein